MLAAYSSALLLLAVSPSLALQALEHLLAPLLIATKRPSAWRCRPAGEPVSAWRLAGPAKAVAQVGAAQAASVMMTPLSIKIDGDHHGPVPSRSRT